MGVSHKSHQIIQISLLKQHTDSHCGPAVLQMLFSFLNKNITQKRIVVAARVQRRIKEDGMRPYQMARAVRILAPTVQFWFKQHAIVEDLDIILNTYHWPVAINWQGLFYDKPEDEPRNSQADHGHYSVVIGINRKKDTITIADPYREYSQKPRVFSLSWFEQRWWDMVEDTNKKTKHIEVTATHHFLFVVTPKKAKFPKELGLLLPDQLDVLRQPPLFTRMFNFLKSGFKNA